MPAAFETSSDTLTLARADVLQAHSALASAVGDVAARVTSLVGDGWRGAAATAFGAGFDEWRRGAATVLAALSDTGEALAATRVAYDTADTAAHDVFARLDARLGAA